MNEMKLIDQSNCLKKYKMVKKTWSCIEISMSHDFSSIKIQMMKKRVQNKAGWNTFNQNDFMVRIENKYYILCD